MTGGHVDLAQMSRGAADLSRRELPAAMRESAMKQAEAALGMRCGGCDERITTGFEFTSLSPVMTAQGVAVETLKLAACNGDNGCDFAAKAREGATAVEMREYVWLDDDEPGADAAEPEETAPAD